MKIITGSVEYPDFESQNIPMEKGDLFIPCVYGEEWEHIKHHISDYSSLYLLPKWYLYRPAVTLKHLAEMWDIEIVFHNLRETENKKRIEQVEMIDKISGALQDTLGITREEIMGTSREQRFTFPRFILSHYLYNSGMRILEIAKFQNKRHTTIKHHLKKYGEEYRFNPSFRKLSDEIREVLREE